MRVAVLGGGITGVCAALELAERGLAVDLYEQDAQLTEGFRADRSVAELSKLLGRSEQGITARLMRLGLIDRR